MATTPEQYEALSDEFTQANLELLRALANNEDTSTIQPRFVQLRTQLDQAYLEVIGVGDQGANVSPLQVEANSTQVTPDGQTQDVPDPNAAQPDSTNPAPDQAATTAPQEG